MVSQYTIYLLIKKLLIKVSKNQIYKFKMVHYYIKNFNLFVCKVQNPPKQTKIKFIWINYKSTLGYFKKWV